MYKKEVDFDLRICGLMRKNVEISYKIAGIVKMEVI